MATKLLPSNHKEFNTKTYWDKFFQERDNESFEWYGTYNDIKHLGDSYE